MARHPRSCSRWPMSASTRPRAPGAGASGWPRPGMKKAVLLLALLLSACAPASTPTPAAASVHSLPTQDYSAYQASVEDFQLSRACPNLCWLGVNPGVTGASEAYALLSKAEQIEQKSLTASDTGIQVSWFTEKTKTLRASVYVYFEHDLVKSVSFTNLAPFTVQDFSKLLGEPEGINISMEVVNGTVMHMPYGLLYGAHKVMAASEAGDPGPQPNDSLTNLTMNLDYDSQFFKPWVGYGHLEVYLA